MISKTIKRLIKEAKESIKNKTIKDSGFSCNEIIVPIHLDGVIDKVIWNKREKRFTELHLTMNNSKRSIAFFPESPMFKDTCKTDKIKTVVIDLETETIIKELK